MMKKYIDADALYERLEKRYQQIVENYAEFDARQYIMGFGEAINALKNEPAADVQEVKHAKWVPDKKQYGMVICSNCYRSFCCEWIHYQYCYFCGARMEEK